MLHLGVTVCIYMYRTCTHMHFDENGLSKNNHYIIQPLVMMIMTNGPL